MGNENDIDLFLYRSAKDLLSVNRGNLENACLHWLRCVDANRETDRRNYARDFMLSIIEDELTSIVEDREAYNDLITLFKDLEKIFRIANSMEGSSRAVREHLDHTIRDFLFSFYLLSRKQNKPDSTTKKMLAVATCFHDVAYPVEKIKEAAKQIEVLPRFLCTEHKQEFEIVGADKLLGVLHTIGSLRNDQYKDIYQLMLCPAVAGKGLYDTRHNLASVVMFLFPIVQQKQMDSRFWESKASVLGVICEAIAYHDRQMMPPLLKMHDVSRCLRIADELQEWERGPGKGSYFDQTEIVEDTEHWIEILFKLRGDKDFDPVRLVADKLLGLTPVVGSRAIKVTLELPRLEEGCRYSSLDSHER